MEAASPRNSDPPPRDAPKARHLAAKLFELALEGDLSAIREVLNRIEGKPTQRVESRAINSNLTIDAEQAQRMAIEFALGAGLVVQPAFVGAPAEDNSARDGVTMGVTSDGSSP